MDLDRLKTLLAIDKSSLDEEVSKQPMLFFDVAEAVVIATAERDACKEELSTIDAELDGQVRIALAKSEEKVTEAMVKNSVQMHKKHETAFDTYMAAKIKADTLSAMKEAFSQRRNMISDMVSLYCNSYWQSTSISPASMDKAVYKGHREKLAAARKDRGK